MIADPKNLTSLTEEWLLSGKPSLKEGTRFVGLDEVGRAWALAQQALHSTRPILAVFSSKASARSVVENLEWFLGRERFQKVHYLPHLDFDFYRGVLPDPQLTWERNRTLYHALNDPEGRIFVTSVSALMLRTCSATEFLQSVQSIQRDQTIERDVLIHTLLDLGYQKQPSAVDPGVFSVRGGVVDIFSPLYKNPFRVEFFDEMVEEIRFFDARSQRSLETVSMASAIPVNVAVLPAAAKIDGVLSKIKERLDSLGTAKSDRDQLIEKFLDRHVPTDAIFLYPYLCDAVGTVFDYFPKNTAYWWEDPQTLLEQAEQEELPKLKHQVELFEKQPAPIAPFEMLSLRVEDIRKETHKDYYFQDFDSGKDSDLVLVHHQDVHFGEAQEQIKQKSRAASAMESFSKTFKEWLDHGYHIHLVCHSRTHAERFQSLVEPYGIRTLLKDEGLSSISHLMDPIQAITVWQGFLSQSRAFPSLKLVLLSEEAIFGQKRRTKTAASTKPADTERLLTAFRQLGVGDLVVHKDHGIGKYLGLKTIETQGISNDFVLLEYKDGDKLYIPVYRLNVLQRYSGGDGFSPPIDKLGGEAWEKNKAKAKRAATELAGEFLRLQALRKTRRAHACSQIGPEYQQFEMEFPFDETPDQLKAIDDVMADLSQTQPMDRLICGDVGYGKTEVAMRAAYRTLIDGKQVGVLVPTTVLAFQHFESFKKRFKNSAVRVEMVSRMRSNAENKKALEAVKQGQVDILVGTHRLLSMDVAFKDLGIVIVDEEHRFGVVQKERLKKMCAEVHFMAMSATPIPRTLNMALGGLKEISIITTPPPDRLAVRTFVCRRNGETIAEAVSNELSRGGQVFFVHNRIETLFGIAEELQTLLPKVKMEIAHGQMDGDILEKKMLAFYQGEVDLLLCTSIIESGIDIPRANTILIDRADIFGLAQLYQLRGRVGRSSQRAYCYLLVPSENTLTEDAKQRLQVIQRYTDLGAGFNIASHDLEIRGAGDLLGREQSGHLNTVGMEMYLELLEESIQALRGETHVTDIEPEINMKIAASFPEDYLPEIGERVALYRRLSGARSENEIAEIESEIRDRFGPLPIPVTNLLGLMQIRLFLKNLHVLRMSCGPKRTSLQFADSTPVSPERIIKLVKNSKGKISLTPDNKLVFETQSSDWREQFKQVAWIADEIGV